jgi:Zn-dependent M28 family amino/carboxypeptidase
VAASDHFSFWRQGYPAFMVTDTAYYRYPYYHTAFDTPDKLCYQPFASLTYGLCQTFNSLASGALD